MDISKAIAITGWMTTAELEWLAKQAASYMTIVEVGSYIGRSTRALADNTPGKVTAIDNWYGPQGMGNSKPLEGNNDSLASSGQYWSDEERAQLYCQFKSNLDDHITSGKVIPIQMDHANCGEIDIMADMVFIDGDHSWEGVTRDVQIWKDKVKKGGLLSGHDGNQQAVIASVRKFFLEAQLAPGTTIWYVNI